MINTSLNTNVMWITSLFYSCPIFDTGSQKRPRKRGAQSQPITLKERQVREKNVKHEYMMSVKELTEKL